MERAELTHEKMKKIIALVTKTNLKVLITDTGHIAYETPTKIVDFEIHGSPLDMEKEVTVIRLDNNTRCKFSSSTGFKLSLEINEKFADLIFEEINSKTNELDKVIITVIENYTSTMPLILEIARGE